MDARTTAGCTVKYDCNPTCPSRKPFKKRPTRRGGIHAARAPCPHHQLSPICCAVGAGHARPSTLLLLQFNLPYCREGACPSAAHCLYCPLLPPGRPCRGGIHAARPTFPSQPLVPITTHHPNIHLAQKSLSKFVKKSEKTVDKSHTPCYNNQAVSRRTRREKRFITACICFLKKNFFKKLSENPLTIKRF